MSKKRIKTAAPSASATGINAAETADITAADAALERALGNDGLEDVLKISDGIRTRSLTFLASYVSGGRYAECMEKAGILPWELTMARRESKRFAECMDAVRTARGLDTVLRAEDELRALALGEVEEREGYLQPSEKAAALLLSAWDGRYKPGASVPCTAINIQVNGLPM